VKETPMSETRPEFVAMSRFVIANGMEDEVKAAFRARPHLVDNASGFLRLDVLSPLEAPGEIWIMTYWTDAGSYRAWHRSHVYHDAHQGIPKGLRLVPGAQKVSELEYVCG